VVALFPALWYGEGKGVDTMREQQTLGRRIQEARKAAGLSQESLGERLGGEVVKVVFLMELAGLKGRERLNGYDVASVICYDGK